ncbi:MAG: cache domain-containing sensor histidine kinase [Patescibacteria group bacterium]
MENAPIATRAIKRRLNLLQNTPLRTKLIAACAAVAITSVLACTLVLYNKSERAVRQRSNFFVRDSAERIALTAGNFFAELDAVVQFLYWDPDVQAVMRHWAKPEPNGRWTYDEWNARQRANDVCWRAMGFRDVPILAVQDMHNTTRVSTQGGAEIPQQDFDLIAAGQGRVVILGPRWQRDSLGGKYHVFTVGRLLRDTIRGEPLGVVFASAEYNSVARLLHDVNQPSDVPMTTMLIDRSGRLLASGSPVKQEILRELARHAVSLRERGIADFRGYFAAAAPVRGTHWLVVQAVPNARLYSETGDLLRDTLLTVGLSLVVALFLAAGLTSYITAPIRILAAKMAAVREGELAGDIPVEGRDELGQLSARFNEMLGDVQRLLDQVRLEQEQKRLAELTALQVQIGPHFLYHAVDSIRWLAVINHDRNIERLAQNLSRLLQICLESPTELTTVERELEFVRCYVEIERLRRVEPFSFEIETAPGVADCQTLRLVIQPLVENAIFHGLETGNLPGRILVRALAEGDDLVIEVADNGVGMDNETIAKLRAGSSPRSSRGIGVRNVQERIRLYYGEEYGLSFESRLGYGTVARIRQPLRKG